MLSSFVAGTEGELQLHIDQGPLVALATMEPVPVLLLGVEGHGGSGPSGTGTSRKFSLSLIIRV